MLKRCAMTKAGQAYKKKLLKYLTAPDWKKALAPQFEEPYFNELCDKLAQEEKAGPIFPPIEHIFEPFNFTPIDSVKVIILGQGTSNIYFLFFFEITNIFFLFC